MPVLRGALLPRLVGPEETNRREGSGNTPPFACRVGMEKLQAKGGVKARETLGGGEDPEENVVLGIFKCRTRGMEIREGY